MEEGHTTGIFLLCTTFMDDEADSFGKSNWTGAYRLTFELCCRTQYVQYSKRFHQFNLVNLLKKHARGTFPCTLTIVQLQAPISSCLMRQLLGISSG